MPLRRTGLASDIGRQTTLNEQIVRSDQLATRMAGLPSANRRSGLSAHSTGGLSAVAPLCRPTPLRQSRSKRPEIRRDAPVFP